MVSATSFAVMAIIGRVGGPADLGVYGIVWTTLWLMASFPNSLIWMPFTAKAPRYAPDRLQRFQSGAAVQMLAILVLMLLPSAGLAVYFQRSPAAMFGCIAVFFIGLMLREHTRRVCMAIDRIPRMLAIDIPSSLLQLIILSALALTDHFTIERAMAAIGLSCLVPLGLAASRERNERIGRRYAWLSFRQNWKLGRWLAAGSLAGSCSDLSLRFAIEGLLGLAAQGRFTASLAIPSFANPVVLTAANYLRVMMARQAAREGTASTIRLYYRSVAVFAGAGLMLYGSIAALAQWISRYTFGEQFAGLEGMIALNCLASWILTISFPSESYLVTVDRGRALLIGAVLRLGTVAVLAIPLLSAWGLYGAGICWAAGFAAAFVFQSVVIHRSGTERTASFLRERPLQGVS